MQAVVEVCRIVGIERQGRKSWKRRELRARPLPAIANEIVDAERAGTRGMRAHRGGIPGMEVKIAVALGWRLVAPGIVALLRALRSTISGAMELRFSGKLAPEPIRVCGGFCVTQVYRSFLGEADFAKHGAIQPKIALGPPEHRVLNIFFGSPGPAFESPKRAILVTPSLHKPQKVVVRNVMAIDGELRNGDFVSGKFVVPAKLLIVRIV